MTDTRCDVCHEPLTETDTAELCFTCASAGVKFSRAWAADLRHAGATWDDVVDIVWRPPAEATAC